MLSQLKISFLGFILLISFTYPLVCQEIGKPFIRNYSPKEYSAHTQNWAVIQDNRGVMYFGNGDGILEYDGVNWRLIPLPNKSTIRSFVKTKDGVIHIGSKKEFGYLSPDSTGTLKYVSLINKIPQEHREFTEVWHSHVNENTVYFISGEKAFRWSQNKMTVFEAEDRFNYSFIYDNELYVLDVSKGLKKIYNNNLSLIPNGESLASKEAQSAIPLDDGRILLVSNSMGLKTLSIKQENYSGQPLLTDYFVKAQDFVLNKSLYTNIKLKNNEIFMGSTEVGGLILDEKSGFTKLKINKQNGLAMNIVFASYQDRENNLWLGLTNGLAQIETSSPITYWDKGSGIQGPLESIVRFKGTIYFTNHRSGVFYIDDNNEIKRIPGFNKMCWSLLKFNPTGNAKDEQLLVGSTEIYEIRNRKKIRSIYKVSKGNTVYELIQSKTNPNTLFAGLTDGIAFLKYENNKWQVEDEITGLEGQTRGIGQESDGTIWMGTFRTGAVKIEGSDLPYSQRKISYYKQDKGLPSLKNVLVYPFRGGLTFGTEFGLYKYEKSSDRFVPDDRLGDQFISGKRDVFSFIENKDGNVWISGLFNKTSSIGVNRLNKDGSYTWYEKPFKIIPEMMVLAFYVEANGTAWVGGSEGLFKYNPSLDNKTLVKKSTLIREVKIVGDSTIYLGSNYQDKNGKRTVALAQNNSLKPVLSYNQNSITFHYTFPSYTEFNANRFQYFLEGYDQDWSNPTNQTYKEYTNLHEGNYSFKVRAENIYGEKSEIASYEFSINPPFYRTFLAYILYFILFSLIVYMFIVFNTKRLKRENERLENIITERTAEIVEKNAELEQQTDEIVAQRDSLEGQNRKITIQNEQIKSSINYALTIQQAMLPIKENMDKFFDSMILYRPKDIVSGDFYWFTTVQTPKNETLTFVAAVDCTGHGVPGAFMSMISSQLLSEIVIANKIYEPSEILTQLNSKVQKALKQEITNNRDGMDLVLCRLEPNEIGTKITFSGAKNSLYYSKKETNGVVHRIKGSRSSIGGRKAKKKKIFSQTEIDFQKGDCIYLMTDGFIDQNNKNRKRFGSRTMENVLSNLSSKSLREQKRLIESELDEYMKDTDQRDDILLIGLKVR